MNALIAAQGLLLYAALAWKLSHLRRAPRDLPLRCVTACLACAGLAYPFGIAATLRPASGAAPWLMLIQCALLLVMAYALNCFFLFSLLPVLAARTRARRRALPLAAAVAVMVAAAAATPAGTRMNNQSVPAVALLYLTFDLSIAWMLADAWRWARRGAKDTSPALARGLRLASAGLALMVTGVVPLATVVILRWAHLTAPVALSTAGRLLVIPGILVFMIGICYPGAVMRLSAARIWARHRHAYRDLEPLWTALHHAFPQDALSRVPARPWRDAFSPWGMHRRYYRRVIECRDGLVRISPHLAQAPSHPGEHPLAEQLLTALATLSTDTPTATAEAVPVAMPAGAGLDADARALAALARDITAARSGSSLRHARQA